MDNPGTRVTLQSFTWLSLQSKRNFRLNHSAPSPISQPDLTNIALSEPTAKPSGRMTSGIREPQLTPGLGEGHITMGKHQMSNVVRWSLLISMVDTEWCEWVQCLDPGSTSVSGRLPHPQWVLLSTTSIPMQNDDQFSVGIVMFTLHFYKLLKRSTKRTSFWLPAWLHQRRSSFFSQSFFLEAIDLMLTRTPGHKTYIAHGPLNLCAEPG
ncbi:uncharacterized protein LOC144092114 [Stigmatopora argus]